MYRLFVLAPSLSGQVSDTSSLGASMQMCYSDFKTDTALPAPNGQGFVQTKGLYKRQSSFGVGWRIGLTWDASELLTLGASYATPIRFKKFTKYNDVFSGPMDTPENFVIGSAWHLARDTDFLLDVKQVRYKQVKTLGRLPSNNGFGWSDQTIFMAGITQRFDEITGRLGYSYAKSPIKSDRSFANALAPAIAEQHFTAGLSYKSSEKMEWFSNVWYSPKKTQTDPGTGDMFSKGGKNTKISMHQYGFSLGAKYNF
jgi:long-chain fatty acid transport protein